MNNLTAHVETHTREKRYKRNIPCNIHVCHNTIVGVGNLAALSRTETEDTLSNYTTRIFRKKVATMDKPVPHSRTDTGWKFSECTLQKFVGNDSLLAQYRTTVGENYTLAMYVATLFQLDVALQIKLKLTH